MVCFAGPIQHRSSIWRVRDLSHVLLYIYSMRPDARSRLACFSTKGGPHKDRICTIARQSGLHSLAVHNGGDGRIVGANAGHRASNEGPGAFRLRFRDLPMVGDHARIHDNDRSPVADQNHGAGHPLARVPNTQDFGARGHATILSPWFSCRPSQRAPRGPGARSEPDRAGRLWVLRPPSGAVFTGPVPAGDRARRRWQVPGQARR